MKEPVFTGTCPAIVTPFDEQLRVDEEAFVTLHQHLCEHGSDGVVAGSLDTPLPLMKASSSALPKRMPKRFAMWPAISKAESLSSSLDTRIRQPSL